MTNTPRDRVLRVLAVLAWMNQHPNTTVTELAQRFDVTRDHLMKDLESLIPFCGLPPYTPDRLIDVIIEGDHIEVRFAEYFNDPISLTAEEGLSVLLAAEGLLAAEPGNDALQRAIEKLRVHLGVGIETDFASVPEIAVVVSQAIERNVSLAITYYSFHRDQTTHRVVDPLVRFWADGHWYLAAYCHRAQAERFFRFDRIRSIELTEQTRTHEAHRDVQFWSGTTIAVEVSCSEPIGRELETLVGAVAADAETGRWQFEIADPIALDRIILRFGNELQIRQPAALKGRPEFAAARVLAAYEQHARLHQ